MNDFIYSLTRQKMEAKVLIMVKIGLEINSSNRIKENTKESDFRQLNLVLDSLEIITSLQGSRILFLGLFSSEILKQLNNRSLRWKVLKILEVLCWLFFSRNRITYYDSSNYKASICPCAVSIAPIDIQIKISDTMNFKYIFNRIFLSAPFFI